MRSYGLQTNDASFYSKEAATASVRPVLYIDAYSGARMQTEKPVDEIKETTQSLKVKILPNPSTHSFVLNAQSSNTKQVQVIVRNISGQLVKKYMTTPGQSLTIGNEWKAGVYFAEIRQERESRIVKLIKH